MFGERFLEPLPKGDLDQITWAWEPNNPDAKAVYASGGNTISRSSTYAAEKDDREDDDRPNEGRFH
jgi:hypothetical protein